MVEINHALSYLNLEKETLENYIIIIKDYNQLNKESKDGKIITFDNLMPYLRLLEKYNYLRFIDGIITKERFISFFEEMYKSNPIKRKKSY